MIEGHGDDAYHYEDIRSDFSSNICAHGSHQALMSHLADHPELLSHYPEPEAWTLERMIAEYHCIAPQQVIVTSGATEAIYLVARSFGCSRAIIPTPTFSEYADASEQAGLAVATPSLLSREQSGSGSLLWLCNPNNPTGDVYDQLYIDRMMAEFDLVVLDQSYENYTDAHVVSPRWGVRTPNAVQIHSMTKTYGVPGLRLGYITAHESLTEQMRRFMHPWSVSALAVEAGKYLLQHDELICRPDLQEAQRLREGLQCIAGLNVGSTQTNFMLCQLSNHTASELKDYLALEHHILIRDASNFKGLTPGHFRVAAQTPAENDALVEAIRAFFKDRQLKG